MYGAKTMTNNKRERVIKLEKGQTLYVVCPPLQPFRVFFDSKLNDLAIAECDPQDVPTIEENATAIPQQSLTEILKPAGEAIEQLGETLKYGVSNDPPLAGEVQKLVDEGHTVECAARILLDDGKCCCSKLGFTPTMPERFNRDTAQKQIAAVTETLGPVAGLYKHEKEVRGATITTYTHNPASPFKADESDKPKPHTPECIDRSKAKLEFVCSCGASPQKPHTDLFSLESDIPFDLS